MAWLQKIINRLKVPKVKTREQLDACAIEIFTERVRVRHTDAPRSERLYLGGLVENMRTIESRGITRLWLETVDSMDFILEETDKMIKSLSTVLFLDSNPKVCNVRKMWESFVHNAIVINNWDISNWPQKERWFKVVLAQSFCKSNNIAQSASDYTNAMAKKHIWARDALIEHRVLNLTTTDTMEVMLEGEFSTRLPFIIALAGIILRMHLKSPTTAMSLLYTQSRTAWPAELAQLECTMHVLAAMDGTSLENCALVASTMELSTGYSSYLPVYGESVHTVFKNSVNGNADAISLPALD